MRALLMLAIFAVVVPDRQDPTPKEAKPLPAQLLGDWQDRNNKILVFRIMTAESVFLVNGQPNPADGLTATYSIDWTKNPVAIDFIARGGGRELNGILKLEGDRLTLALPLNNSARPSDFGPGNLVLPYQRVRK
jgi:uncharacterized protein (TIGR03067 family)